MVKERCSRPERPPVGSVWRLLLLEMVLCAGCGALTTRRSRPGRARPGESCCLRAVTSAGARGCGGLFLLLVCVVFLHGFGVRSRAVLKRGPSCLRGAFLPGAARHPGPLLETEPRPDAFLTVSSSIIDVGQYCIIPL